jgi:hypothetical protein
LLDRRDDALVAGHRRCAVILDLKDEVDRLAGLSVARNGESGRRDALELLLETSIVDVA